MRKKLLLQLIGLTIAGALYGQGQVESYSTSGSMTNDVQVALPSGNSLEAKLFREALTKGREYRDYYVLINDGNKALMEDDVIKFCREHNYLWNSKYVTKTVSRFGDVVNSVFKFFFIPKSLFSHYVFEWCDRSSFKGSQLKSKGIAYFYDPEANQFISLRNALWTGDIVDGYVNGHGAGICQKDDQFFYYFTGTFQRGFPIGKATYRYVDTDDNIAWGYSPREKTPSGRNGNGAPFREVEVGKMSEGMAAFRYLDNGGVSGGSPSKNFGYIDQNGYVIIKPSYQEASPFNGGRAAVKNDKGEEVYIDKAGQMIDYTQGQKNIFAREKARQDSIQAAENRKKLLAEQKAAEEKRAAEAKEAALKRRIEANKNTKLWSKGCRLAYRFPNGTEYVIATLEEWNENRSRVKVKIVASPSATREIKGERLEKNNTLWVSAHNEGWHLALDEEIDIALKNDHSVKHDTPQTIYVDPRKNDCPKCNGRGTIPCYNCNGTGRYDFGEKTCRSCYGKGSITCPECWGSGRR